MPFSFPAKASLFFLLITLFLFPTLVNGQTVYPISGSGATITGCSGIFTDSGGSFGDYDDNETSTITFCSGSEDVLSFVFNPDETDSNAADGNFWLLAGDVLNVYDGTSTSGTLITTITSANDPGDDHFTLYSISPCITFEFISNGSGNESGWEAWISCVPEGCGNNPVASDAFADAPYICNLDGYCGTTSGYTEDNPGNMDGSGGTCPTLFGGTIENNSWLQFEAASTSITLTITVPACYGAFGLTTNFTDNGIQMGILEWDGTNFTLVSDCTQTDGNNNGTFNVTSNSLVPGNTYYIMVDGYEGSECDYYIETTGGVTILDAGPDASICNGTSTTLTASGPSGATYTWTGSDGFGPTTGTSVTVSPSTNTTYTVEVTGGGLCDSQTDEVDVTVTTCTTCSIDVITAGTQTVCNNADNTYTQQITITYTNPPGTGTLLVNGQSFPIGTSPQTITLSGLPSNGNPVDVTASFSADAGCTLTENALFTAPVPCSAVVCSIDGLTAGNQTPCNTSNNTYTQEVIVTYSNPPATGNLVVNGQSFAIGTSPQTVVLTGLNSDGNSVNVTASFSDDTGCNITSNGLFTAPTSCGTPPCAPLGFLK